MNPFAPQPLTHSVPLSIIMKAMLHPCVLLMAFLTGLAQAQTIKWGSEVFSDLLDSKGDALGIKPGSSFVFELGAFNAGFIPQPQNMDQWFSMWNVFDRASYNAVNGYFTSSVQMTDEGTSNSLFLDLTPATTSFAGLPAYLWVRNVENGLGSENLLVRPGDAEKWKFPSPVAGCCDNEVPLEWSVSDLAATDIPRFGSQGDVRGPGERTYDGYSNLQTHTSSSSEGEATPEPGASVLVLVLGVMALLDRRRVWCH